MRRIETLLTAAVVLASGLALHGCGSSTVSTAESVTSGDCAREQTLVRRALSRSTLRVDVDGDGRLDKVAVATDEDAGKRCRAFVGVRLRSGSTYSTHLYRGAVPPKGFQAEVVGLPDLGDAPGAQIVVDTHAAVDSVLAQLFTLTDEGLWRAPVPALEGGTFIVEGAGVIYPQGAGCSSEGQMVLSSAEQTPDGKRYRVTRHTYEVGGDKLVFGPEVVESATVGVNRLVDRFPEFTRPHWRACTGIVRR